MMDGPITEAAKLREERASDREALIGLVRREADRAEVLLLAACRDTDIAERAEAAREATACLDRACALGEHGISQGWGEPPA